MSLARLGLQTPTRFGMVSRRSLAGARPEPEERRRRRPSSTAARLECRISAQSQDGRRCLRQVYCVGCRAQRLVEQEAHGNSCTYEIVGNIEINQAQESSADHETDDTHLHHQPEVVRPGEIGSPPGCTDQRAGLSPEHGKQEQVETKADKPVLAHGLKVDAMSSLRRKLRVRRVPLIYINTATLESRTDDWSVSRYIEHRLPCIKSHIGRAICFIVLYGIHPLVPNLGHEGKNKRYGHQGNQKDLKLMASFPPKKCEHCCYRQQRPARVGADHRDTAEQHHRREPPAHIL